MNDMTSFFVRGPYEIKFESRKGGRALIFDRFWSEESEASDLAGKRGCYVFAMRAGGGLQPIYVGKATKNFKQETFNPSNKHKFHNGFSRYSRGTPVIYFVVHPLQKGRTNAKQIAEIEDS